MKSSWTEKRSNVSITEDTEVTLSFFQAKNFGFSNMIIKERTLCKISDQQKENGNKRREKAGNRRIDGTRATLGGYY